MNQEVSGPGADAGGSRVGGQDVAVLESRESRVLAAAEAVARALPAGDAHTVAAAVMDTDGGIHTGANVFHFTGGPCAELVALGTAAAAGAGSLELIVAVGEDGRGVMAPCGRCRQVLIDLHPEISVLVLDESGRPVATPVCDLLPNSYRAPVAT
jgi:cytidine deaminase